MRGIRRAGAWTAIMLGVMALLASALRFAHLPSREFPSDRQPSTQGTRETPLATPHGKYLWPTNASRTITSTFGEFRRTHFHAGLDISTSNTTGYPVFAAQDGYIARIVVSPVGYGRMLELRHDDGYSTIYAHLQRFNAEVSARAKKEQDSLGRYPVEIRCRANAFPVKKGERIAYTGDTGEGPPHLHFEIRDKHGDPVNPFLMTDVWSSDTIPPSVQGITVVPLGEGSLVNGTLSHAMYRPHGLSPHHLEIRDTIQITGRIGFEISARDRANNSRYRRSVYAHRLFIDDSCLYTAKIDRVPGINSYQIGLYYDWPLYDAGEGRFERLYVDSPNDLMFYSPPGTHSGIVRTESFVQGLHTFSIASTDFNGNETSVTGHLLINHPPRITSERVDTGFSVRLIDGGPVKSMLVYSKGFEDHTWLLRKTIVNPTGTASGVTIPHLNGRADILKIIAVNAWGTHSLPCFEFERPLTTGGGSLTLREEIEPEFVRVTLKTDRVFTSPPSVYVYEGGTRRPIDMKAFDLDEYSGTFRPLESFQGTRRLFAQGEVNGKEQIARKEFDIFPIARGAQGILTLDEGNLKITYDSLSVLKTVFFHYQKSVEDGEPVYRLLPERSMLDRGCTVSVRVSPPHAKRALLYRTAGSNRLIAKARSVADTVLTGRITRTLGELETFIDTEPPYVYRLKIRPGPHRRPTISFRFDDDLSGIEYNELKTYIDGNVVVPEVDGEHHVASYQVDQPLARGSHRLVIRLTDRLGNSDAVDRDFQVQ